MEIEVRKVRESFFKFSFLRKEKEVLNQIKELHEGDTLVAKEKRLKFVQKFYDDPNPTFVIERTYKSNDRIFCVTTDYTLECPEGKRGQIHAFSFLQTNFQFSPKPSQK